MTQLATIADVRQTQVARASLRANVQWSLLGSVAYALCQWVILIVLVKLGSAEAVGQFALGLAVTAPIILLANMQLSALQASDARRDFRFGHYLALRLLTTGLALFATVGIVLLEGYSTLTATVVLLIGLAKAIESISDIYQGLMQQHQRMERVAWSLGLKGMLAVMAMSAWLGLGGSIAGAACAMALAWLVVLVGYDVPSGTRLLEGPVAPAWEWPVLARLVKQALPIGVRTMLLTLCANIPRYFLEHYHGAESLGIFAALAYVTVVGQVLSNALAQAAAPRLAEELVAGRLGAFRTLTLRMAGIGALIGAAGVGLAAIAARPLLTLLYKPEYAEHTAVFVWLMFGSALWCIVPVLAAALNAARRPGSQALVGLIVTGGTVLASIVLVPSHGLMGAALATVVSALIGLIAFSTLFFTIRKLETP